MCENKVPRKIPGPKKDEPTSSLKKFIEMKLRIYTLHPLLLTQ